MKLTLHVFVCDSGNYMDNLFRSYFLENLISVTRRNKVFRIDFAIISDWSVKRSSQHLACWGAFVCMVFNALVSGALYTLAFM